MRFRPKSRASMDQAPGPIIAKVPPRTPKIRGTPRLPGRECDPGLNNRDQNANYRGP